MPIHVNHHPRNTRPVIIGGGIAGACLAHGFIRRGITPTLIDPRSNTAASGNPAGLVMPKLDLQDRPESRFYNAAYLYASNLYHAENLVQNEGALHLATSEKEQERFAKIYTNQALPESHMQAVDNDAAQVLMGASLKSAFGGLYFPKAQIISPRNAVQKLAGNANHIQASADKVTCKGKLWSIWDVDGLLLSQTDNLFLCNGANIQNIWPIHEPLDVRFTRGQLCWNNDVQPLNHALIAGNYAVPYQGGMLLGATHDHVSAGEDASTRTPDTAEIVAKYSTLFDESINGTITTKDWHARAAVRVTTRNTLPIATLITNHSEDIREDISDFYLLSGLGSRGLMMAPLLGEHLVCNALGEPSPLGMATALRFGLPRPQNNAAE